MRVVAVLALPGVVGFDLMVPCVVFGAASDRVRRYEVRVCAAPGAGSTTRRYGGLTFRAPFGLDGLDDADLVVVPGYDLRIPEPPAALDALRRTARRATVASICTGAFALAAAGLLDGLRATTHWQYAALLKERHPRVEVAADALYLDNGSLLTSAGVAAGLDLCLYLVGRDHGAAVAAETARTVVMPLHRDGGQAQYVAYTPPADATAIAPLLDRLRARLGEPLTLASMAAAGGMSVRSLQRRFADQVGSSPLQWLLRARIDRARQLLETTDLPIDRVAAEVGFGSPVTLRHHFGRVVGVAPTAYRATFQGK
ncbi:AraC family transcriptional regulator [Virgisporangium aliadipatigenens]|uniref:AraC family transcriptional regulator n=1 Tax=Virgisporangium aliadipatigenens TaxID=741659 RepID=A0A8J4DU48_9ACTN|nr:helix-turn-helix domain-containing protein [Virgisporangium aliadipatigenens]GIJ49961.1 AraC family transcriptional regulator [Virgisporangium aliadipatigenens]